MRLDPHSRKSVPIPNSLLTTATPEYPKAGAEAVFPRWLQRCNVERSDDDRLVRSTSNDVLIAPVVATPGFVAPAGTGGRGVIRWALALNIASEPLTCLQKTAQCPPLRSVIISLTTIMCLDVYTSLLCTCRRTVQTAADTVHTGSVFTRRVLSVVDLYRIPTQS